MGCALSKPTRVWTLREYLAKARTGDLCLFSSTGPDARCIRCVTCSPFSHCGLAVVLEDPDDPESVNVNLWHSPNEPTEGLPDLLSDPPEFKDGPQLNDMRAAAKEFGQYARLRVRRIHFSKGSRHQWAQNDGVVVHYEDHFDDNDHNYDAYDYMRDYHRKHYETSLVELALAEYDGPLGENKENPHEFFCSELVAHMFKKFGIMRTREPSNEFVPDDFREHNAYKLNLRRDVWFGEEIEIEV